MKDLEGQEESDKNPTSLSSRGYNFESGKNRRNSAKKVPKSNHKQRNGLYNLKSPLQGRRLCGKDMNLPPPYHPEHTAMKQLKFCCVAIDGQLVFASACWKHSSRPAKISIRYPPDDHIALHNHKPQPPCIKGIKAGGRFR
jgi:hypothetical protein